MSNTIKIEKPCTVVLLFNNANNAKKWIVKSQNGKIYHYREFESPPITAKISFPFAGLFYSNIEMTGIEIFPLETFDISKKLPSPERDYNPEKLYIKKMENLYNTPARTIAKIGLIERGKGLEGLPSQMDFFIMLHEYGHQKYKTEWKTDLYALYWFYKLGYNESQAFYALSKVLKHTDETIDRIKRMFNLIINK